MLKDVGVTDVKTEAISWVSPSPIVSSGPRMGWRERLCFEGVVVVVVGPEVMCDIVACDG